MKDHLIRCEVGIVKACVLQDGNLLRGDVLGRLAERVVVRMRAALMTLAATPAEAEAKTEVRSGATDDIRAAAAERLSAIDRWVSHPRPFSGNEAAGGFEGAMLGFLHTVDHRCPFSDPSRIGLHEFAQHLLEIHTSKPKPKGIARALQMTLRGVVPLVIVTAETVEKLWGAGDLRGAHLAFITAISDQMKKSGVKYIPWMPPNLRWSDPQNAGAVGARRLSPEGWVDICYDEDALHKLVRECHPNRRQIQEQLIAHCANDPGAEWDSEVYALDKLHQHLCFTTTRPKDVVTGIKGLRKPAYKFIFSTLTMSEPHHRLGWFLAIITGADWPYVVPFDPSNETQLRNYNVALAARTAPQWLQASPFSRHDGSEAMTRAKWIARFMLFWAYLTLDDEQRSQVSSKDAQALMSKCSKQTCTGFGHRP